MATLTEVQLSYYIPTMFEDSSLRVLIYDEIVRTAEAPTVATLARLVSSPLDDIRPSLRRMHEGHMLVLQPTGEILMANPFPAVPTPFITEVEGRRWFGNCIWDGLRIIATLHNDGHVLTSCATSGEGVVHFALPARRW